ncbi:MAG TPA: stalk domain-containing protein [Syntrophomonadaceae bacterium]|nr:stalk domain-containing protein [Syntrophomonadaceae bacterium]
MKKSFPILVAAFLFINLFVGVKIASAAVLDTNNKNQKDQIIPIAPSAPTNLRSTCTGAGVVTLTWTDNSNNENGFTIERKSEGHSYDTVASVPANTTTYEESQNTTYPIFPGEIYYYRIKAFTGNYLSSYSNELRVQVVDNAAPIAPTSLKLEPLYTCHLKLTWDDRSNNESGFKVERKMEGGQWQTVHTTYENITEYEQTVFDMPGGVRYTFRIKVFNDTGSAYSNEASIIMPTHAPAAPYLYDVGWTNPTTFKLKWLDKSDNEDGFVILRKKGRNPGEFNFMSDYVGVVNKNVTEYTDSNLELDELYVYRVGAYNLDDHTWSSPLGPIRTGPNPPTVTATADSNHEVKVSWSCSSPDVGRFSLARKGEGGEYAWLFSRYANESQEYTDSNVSPGQTYYYQVTAIRDSYIGESSSQASITVPDGSNQRTSGIPGSLPSGNMPATDTNTIPGTADSSKLKQVISLNLGQTAYRVNSEVRQMDAAPINYEGRTLLPVRYVTEPLGAKLDWDETAQKVTVVLGDKTLELWMGKNTARVNGQEIMIDTSNPQVMPITIPPGRAMLPLRFIAENLGCQVDWNDATQEAILTYAGS